jgi:hypothetical protein
MNGKKDLSKGNKVNITKLKDKMIDLALKQDRIKAFRNKHLGIIQKYECLMEDLSKTTSELKDLAKQVISPNERLSEAGITVSHKVRYSYDAEKLKRAFPESVNIDGLYKTSVNTEVMKAAVAVGKIPQSVADEAKVIFQHVCEISNGE